jgi:hypothetical protein
LENFHGVLRGVPTYDGRGAALMQDNGP